MDIKAIDKRLRENFNISFEERQQIYEFQDRACGMCHTPVPITKAYVDHDHTSGESRGLLCFRCNIQLGFLTADLARKIVAYLESPPIAQFFGAPRIGLPGRVGTKKRRKLIKKLKQKP